ncbi:MAG: DNA translocase FtsK [Methyloprofundus sp.]|nr:DNA translocase FtsK [Methyloprofundus sp.]
MNRKITPPKNYFTFFSALPWRKIMLAGLIVLVLVGFVLLIQRAGSGGENLELADIFAVLALITIPCASLFVGLMVLEKYIGISWLRGVEFVGKYTLMGIDFVYVTIQGWRGIEVKKPNRRVDRPSSVIKKPSVNWKEPFSRINPAIKNPTKEIVEPVFSETMPKETLNNETVFNFQPIHSENTLAEEQQSPVAMDFIVPTTNENRAAKLEDFEPLISNEYSVDSSLVADDFYPDVEISTEEQAGETANLHDASEVIDFDRDLKAFFQDKHDWAGADDAAAVEPFVNVPTVDSDELLDTAEIEDVHEVDVTDDKIHQEEDISLAENMSHDNKPEFPPSIAEIMASMSTFPSINPAEQTSAEAAETVKPVENEKNAALKPKLSIAEIMASATRLAAESIEDKNALAQQEAARLIAGLTNNFAKPVSHFNKPKYVLPAIELLDEHQQSIHSYTEDELDEMSRSVERVLLDYKISVEVVGAYPGPIITRFELSLAPGIKVSRVTGLAKDLARAMLVTSVRVVEIIEGTPFIGLEIPNQERELVSFREILVSEAFQQAKSPLTLALGKDVSGDTVVADLAKMPHLLVAGTTGSGKSVAINTMILSMLFKATPEQVRMIMVDPKMLELSIYEGIPHLLTPVVTDMKEAQNALRWAVAEMERRYKLMAKVGVRNLAGFNQKIEEAGAKGETIRDPLYQLVDPLEEGQTFPVLSTLPSIVIIIDELADMMMVVGKKVEELIARLAQKARAAGIHLILATQRPSVDVLTGLIKANVPTRISFQVSSRIDSRTILDQGGAEALLGNGDMLYLPSGTSVPTRSHGAFVDDHEVHAVVDFLKSLGGANYLDEITQDEPVESTSNSETPEDEVDVLYDEAVNFVMDSGKASISSVQRRFKVGYNRAARMIDQMEEENIISEPEGNGSRRVLNRD